MAATVTHRSAARSVWGGAGLIALACAAAYANTFSVPLVADDLGSIAANPSIRRLWPLSVPLHPPGYGMTVQGRPLLNLSLAVNYAISGVDVWSYHVGNLLIHVLAAWTLFGFLRRIGGRLGRVAAGGPTAAATGQSGAGDREGAAAGWAFAIALVWAVHPLQTESVTYLIQRAESLMGLCYLFTLYAFVRGTERDGDGRWLAGSALACLLGMTAKEVMVSAPVIVLAADILLVAGSARCALRRRWGYYLALAATWIPLAALAIHSGNRGGASGTGPGLTLLQYWLTQPSAVARYLSLAFWPDPLVFYYDAVWFPSIRAVLPEALLVATLAAATLCGLGWRRRPGFGALGWLGLWFFALLAPTSLMPGRSQTVAEHRMYLALIPVLVAAAWAVAELARRVCAWAAVRPTAGWSWILGAGLALPCILATHRRNADYAAPRLLYAHDVAVNPESSAAQGNLGTAYLREGNFPAAAQHLEASLRLGSTAMVTQENLGVALDHLGEWPQAEAHYRAALRMAPNADFFQPEYELFQVLIREGREPEALREMEAMLRAHPERGVTTAVLARTWVQTGLVKDAILLYQAMVTVVPDSAELRSDFGIALASAGRFADATGQYRQALRIKPGDADLHYNLAIACWAEHRTAEAVTEFRAALGARPEFPLARRMLERVEGEAPTAGP
jgi:Flp pilus assembly protein TadD